MGIVECGGIGALLSPRTTLVVCKQRLSKGMAVSGIVWVNRNLYRLFSRLFKQKHSNPSPLRPPTPTTFGSLRSTTLIYIRVYIYIVSFDDYTRLRLVLYNILSSVGRYRADSGKNGCADKCAALYCHRR
jgi:hypothetical protein